MHAAAVRASPLFNNQRSVPVRLVTSSSLHRRQKKERKKEPNPFSPRLKQTRESIHRRFLSQPCHIQGSTLRVPSLRLSQKKKPSVSWDLEKDVGAETRCLLWRKKKKKAPAKLNLFALLIQRRAGYFSFRAKQKWVSKGCCLSYKLKDPVIIPGCLCVVI